MEMCIRDRSVTTKQVVVQSSQAEENAKWESQQVQIITAKEIEEKQAKSVEDVIFNQTGVSKTVDAMGRTGVSIRGAEPRHTLILIDGPVSYTHLSSTRPIRKKAASLRLTSITIPSKAVWSSSTSSATMIRRSSAC